MLNQQPIEKPNTFAGGSELDVHSIFPTLQGEGPFCGVPATFVRLAGCNLQCPMCDTDYTIGRKQMSICAIVERVRFLSARGNTRLVVITGGEPFRQDLVHLCIDLITAGFYVQIETNGTLPPPALSLVSYVNHDVSKRSGVYVVVSPKTGKVNPITASIACAFKYVLDQDHVHEDGLPTKALGHTAHPILWRPKPLTQEAKTQVYLQPADEKEEATNALNTASVIKSCFAHGYTLQLQMHKLLDLE